MDKDRKMMILCLLLAAISRPVFTEEWKANVVKSLNALVTSCVVVPCSFSHPRGKLPTSRLRGIWHLKSNRDQCIYNEDSNKVLDNFKCRTQLLGHLGQSNCTLEITEIKDHDNGPFCFRIELVQSETDTSTKDKFSFVGDCVELTMLPDPPEPTLIHPKTAIQGTPFSVTCSVFHTCPSHAPTLTWSRGTPEGITEVRRKIHPGSWEVQSILTFTPEEKDDYSEVTCRSQFNGGKTSSKTMTLHIKHNQRKPEEVC